MVKTKICVMVSGGGTNLQALIDAQKSGILKSGEIALVAASKPGVYALTRASDHGIPSLVMQDEESLLREMKAQGIELIILAGFLKILSPRFINEAPGPIINVHPALIPSFCGKGAYGLHVHEMALDYGVKITGATVHYVNEIPDGGKIISQKAVEVLDGDTPEILQRRVMEQAEWILLPQAAEDICRQIMEDK